jgi:hypothetical protein
VDVINFIRLSLLRSAYIIVHQKLLQKDKGIISNSATLTENIDQMCSSFGLLKVMFKIICGNLSSYRLNEKEFSKLKDFLLAIAQTIQESRSLLGMSPGCPLQSGQPSGYSTYGPTSFMRRDSYKKMKEYFRQRYSSLSSNFHFDQGQPVYYPKELRFSQMFVQYPQYLLDFQTLSSYSFAKNSERLLTIRLLQNYTFSAPPFPSAPSMTLADYLSQLSIATQNEELLRVFTPID